MEEVQKFQMFYKKRHEICKAQIKKSKSKL